MSEGEILRRRVVTDFVGPSKTEQHHKNTCDVRKIMAKYMKTGTISQRCDGGLYGDFTNAVDFQTAFNKVKEAEKDFLALPAEIRKRFHNNPAELLDFVYNEENRQEAEDLKLIPRSEPVQASEAVVVPSGEGS